MDALKRRPDVPVRRRKEALLCCEDDCCMEPIVNRSRPRFPRRSRRTMLANGLVRNLGLIRFSTRGRIRLYITDDVTMVASPVSAANIASVSTAHRELREPPTAIFIKHRNLQSSQPGPPTMEFHATPVPCVFREAEYLMWERSGGQSRAHFQNCRTLPPQNGLNNQSKLVSWRTSETNYRSELGFACVLRQGCL